MRIEVKPFTGRLSTEQRREIKVSRQTPKQLAAAYGVSERTVYTILKTKRKLL